jgi:hypothetical protein
LAAFGRELLLSVRVLFRFAREFVWKLFAGARSILRW